MSIGRACLAIERVILRRVSIVLRSAPVETPWSPEEWGRDAPAGFLAERFLV
jgi:hypothetical protein